MYLLLKKEIIVQLRESAGFIVPILFFILVILSFAFAFGLKQTYFLQFVAAIMWVAMLLCAFLGVEKLFQQDSQDGTLDYYMIEFASPFALVFLKSFTYWLLYLLPLVLVSVFIAFIFLFSFISVLHIFATMFVGSMALAFIATLGSGLTVSLVRSNMLLAILFLPLCLPMLLFALDAINGILFWQSFLILCSIVLFLIGICSFFCVLVLKYRF